eukprot:CAMPEP_0195625618 /NCGR_PEP_ID=MMETSP0815-20121206/17947_1 /TAXON_ID=97485 /ORGANISM="Prymnesium parvum, Strain Texoma1" /LENGTH=83 /DNA_ID=CAMNT_0040766703 /DNA_START=30 /DNA_END=278 /DNA_ORIENTATION=+
MWERVSVEEVQRLLPLRLGAFLAARACECGVGHDGGRVGREELELRVDRGDDAARDRPAARPGDGAFTAAQARALLPLLAPTP